MPAAVLLAATVAAVLCPREVVLVDTAGPTVTKHLPLPSEGAAVFAAPDGRVVVPLRGEDATVVIAADGRSERWPGRVFPMFFVDYDRMHVVMPGLLATLSYPERLPLQRLPIEGLVAVRRAATSRDGRLVAVLPSGPGPAAVFLVTALEGGTPQVIPLPAEGSQVVVADDGGFAVIATGGPAPEVLVLGQGRAHAELRLSGEARALCLAPGGGGVLVGMASGSAGEVLALGVNITAKNPLKERFRTPLPGPPSALVAAGEDVALVAGDALFMLAKGGKRVRAQVAIPGARGVAVLPSEPKTTVPAWSDHP